MGDIIRIYGRYLHILPAMLVHLYVGKDSKLIIYSKINNNIEINIGNITM